MLIEVIKLLKIAFSIENGKIKRRDSLNNLQKQTINISCLMLTTNKPQINKAQDQQLFEIEKMQKSSQSFKFSFLVVSFIGYISCLDRSDYNVALGIFAFLLWSQSHFPQKHRILWIVLLTVFGDLLWIIAVSVVEWGQEPIQNYNLRTMTQIAAITNMIYKIVLVAYAMCSYEQCSDLFSWSSFKTKVLYL